MIICFIKNKVTYNLKSISTKHSLWGNYKHIQWFHWLPRYPCLTVMPVDTTIHMECRFVCTQNSLQIIVIILNFIEYIDCETRTSWTIFWYNFMSQLNFICIELKYLFNMSWIVILGISRSKLCLKSNSLGYSHNSDSCNTCIWPSRWLLYIHTQWLFMMNTTVISLKVNCFNRSVLC